MTERIIDNELRLIHITGMTRPLFRGIRIWTCVGRWTTGRSRMMWSCCIGCMIILPRTVTAII